MEQKTTIFWNCLYLLASLKASPGLGGVYETNRRGGEENPVDRRNTTVNVDKIRGFRPSYAWTNPSFFSTAGPFTSGASFFVPLLREPVQYEMRWKEVGMIQVCIEVAAGSCERHRYTRPQCAVCKEADGLGIFRR